MIDENEMKRVEYFFKKGSIIHITKKDGFFYNGIILEFGESFLIIKDRKEGNEYYINYDELKKPVEEFTESRK